MLILNVIDGAIVSKIEVIRAGRELCGKSVNLLYDRHDAKTLAIVADKVHVDVGGTIVLEYGTLDLEVRKALHLRQAEQVCRQILEPVEALHLRICPDDVLELAQEPFVDFRQFVDAVDAVAGEESLRNHEDTHVGRFAESLLDVVYLDFLVGYEAVSSLPYHSQAFLDGLFEGPAYCHHLADRLHRRTDLAGDTVEFGEVPARNLADNVVKSRLEECRSGLGDGILQVEEAITQTELGCDKGQRVACGLRCQG